MTNKNDLRYKKNETAIKEAYLELCKKDKVSVRDLCKKAMINNSTFYTHYVDIYDLKDRLQNELIDNLLDNAEYIDEAFTQNELFYKSIINIFHENRKQLNLYFNNDVNDIIYKIESRLLKRYLQNSKPEEEEVLIRFIIGGASNILSTDCSETKIKKTIELIKKVMS